MLLSAGIILQISIFLELCENNIFSTVNLNIFHIDNKLSGAKMDTVSHYQFVMKMFFVFYYY